MKTLPHAIVASAFVLAAAPLSAQTAPPASPTAAASNTSAETVELSPFVVNAESDVGYVATNTLSGSRLSTPLKDTAASISVMTEEFLSDIAATSVDEALKWANNVQEEFADDPGGSTDNNPNGFFGTSNSFRVRGARASLTRNYFEWNLPRDTYNVERIEESRRRTRPATGGCRQTIPTRRTSRKTSGRSCRRGPLGSSLTSGNSRRTRPFPAAPSRA